MILNVIHTSYLTRALLVKVRKSKSCLEPAAVSIAVLTQRVTSEGRGRTLPAATRVATCALVTIITCHAFAVWPRACTSAWITPLKQKIDKWKMFTSTLPISITNAFVNGHRFSCFDRSLLSVQLHGLDLIYQMTHSYINIHLLTIHELTECDSGVWVIALFLRYVARNDHLLHYE